MILSGPGLGAVAQAVGVGLGNHVVHELEAGAAADEALLRGDAQDLGKELLCRRKAGQLAVVAGVDAVDLALGGVVDDGQHVGGQVKLVGAGLAAGHIQGELFGAERVKLGTDLLQLRFALGLGHLFVGVHEKSSFPGFFRAFIVLHPIQKCKDFFQKTAARTGNHVTVLPSLLRRAARPLAAVPPGGRLRGGLGSTVPAQAAALRAWG